MFRSTLSLTTHRHLLLIASLLAAIGVSILVTLSADAGPMRQNISPLSPLVQPATEGSPVETPPSADPAPIPSQVTPVTVEQPPLPLPSEPTPPAEEERAVDSVPAEIATPVTNPGAVEPIRAQISLTLVGLILVGLVGVVVSVIAQARRS